ncbi:Bacteriophytochrome cph2 [Delftia tsuruhatensis]|uniref:sensor domain-containing diguanylate cyclase n=1 Tax=Delftia tsuruhatensis TaxID=180282 RepID=UPI001E79191F|nr:sensor domain-containing diguanylate cyclase [Delftia tsuruhatensis]CAB5721497.1 Bacteriophytochrome cph2 [Delftia tsuruhatensis]CAC9681645.1 Bacteriophytochrome cph2 [Delftia tsuruhatensis]
MAQVDVMERDRWKTGWPGSGRPIKRDARLVAWLLAVVFVSVSAATAWQLGVARQRTLAEVDTVNRNLAQTLNTYAEGVITQSAMLLLGIAERLEMEGASTVHLERLQHLVNRQEHLLNQLDELLIVDAQGRWLMSSRGAFPEGSDSADRDYFTHHRDDASSGIFIGPPIRSRPSGKWVITISRRYNDGQGRFAGVVVVALGIENFLRLFGKIDIGERGAIALSTPGGRLLVRHPFREQDLGWDFSQSPNFLRHYAGAMSGTASFRSGLDGTERIYAFLRSERYPLMTTVALGRDEALATWRRQALLTLAVVLGLFLAIALIGWRLAAAMRLRSRAECSLVSAREELLDANRRLEVLATQDQLTGLANRRRFDEVLEREARRAAREGTPLSLLLIDLDHFKGYNDAYGHVAGDACLQAVGGALAQAMQRPGDMAARYGGEELAVVLPNTDGAGALQVAERLRARIEGLGLPHRGSRFGHVTASIGVATMAVDERCPGAAAPGAGASGTALALVEAADRALYRAKAAGRNCVQR